jgi:hypothetical protein
VHDEVASKVSGGGYAVGGFWCEMVSLGEVGECGGEYLPP